MHEVVPDIFRYGLQLSLKVSPYEDGSSLKATVSSRSGHLPEDHIDKRMGVKDGTSEIRVRSWTGKGNDLVIKESEYVFDEVAVIVKKKLYQPMDDIKRVLISLISHKLKRPKVKEMQQKKLCLLN